MLKGGKFFFISPYNAELAVLRGNCPTVIKLDFVIKAYGLNKIALFDLCGFGYSVKFGNDTMMNV
jgi:hypothetical protein